MSWFARWFRKPAPAPAPVPAPVSAPLPPDDIAVARAAGRDVVGLVMSALKDSRGIHLESLFCALGALAGCACQASVRQQAIQSGRPGESDFTVATVTEGQQFYFGDALNRPLAEDRVSVWSLVAGAAAHDGARELPDLMEIFKHVAATLGSDAFGVPRMPEGHSLQSMPLEYATRLWPPVGSLLRQQLPAPRAWPVALGLAIQEVMAQTRGTLPPALITRIVMESAVPVSKVPRAD